MNELAHFGSLEDSVEELESRKPQSSTERYEIVGEFSHGADKYGPGDEMPDLSDKALQFLLRKGVVRPLEE